MPELDDAALERRLRGVLKEHLGALPLDLTVDALDRRREAKGLTRRSGRGRSITLLAAAALLLVGGALAAGSGILRLPSVVPPVPAPSVVAVATTSPDATSPSPSMLASPTPVPSATPAPMTWTEASLKEDWPAPVRTEPAGGAIVLPVRGELGLFQLADPADDSGSSRLPWVEIRVVHTGSPFKVVIELADNHPPLVDPTEQWIAYGVVVDADRDGVPDWRYGVDNLPIDPSGWAGNPDSERMARGELANGVAPHRAWRTNLHTGRTESAAGPPYGGVGETYFDTFYPPGGYGPDGARLGFGGDVTGGGTRTSLAGPYYTWAAVIENGRVVATDYAPDVGWLDPWADAKP